MFDRPAGVGSRAARQLLVKVPDERIDDLVAGLRADLRGEFAHPIVPLE
jgi:hypothetical protein